MRAVKGDGGGRPQPRRKRAPKTGTPGQPARKRVTRARAAADEEDEDQRPSLISGWLDNMQAQAQAGLRMGAVMTGFFGTVALAGVISGGYVPIAAAAIQSQFGAFTSQSGLNLKAIDIRGNAQTAPEILHEAIGVKIGMALSDVDVHGIRQRLEALSWISAADVRRSWPDRLEVLIVEKRPTAIWQSGGRTFVVDRGGQPITDLNVQAYAHLLLVVGQGAAPEAHKLIESLAGVPSLRPRITAAIRVGQRRWNLRLDNGVEVRLPEEGAEAALSELVRLDNEQQILARDVDAIDLRFPDRLIVKLPPDSPMSPLKPVIEGRDT